MCGIVGYIGSREAAPLLLEGLKKLEYRGYDSAGVAVNDGLGIEVIKKKGKLSELEERMSDDIPVGRIGIGHTRWATHGKPSDRNSHPHYDCNGDFALVHNGIIENFREHRKNLKARGHEFKSDTDTEVIAHLLEEHYNGDLKQALVEVVDLLEGSFALAVLSRQDEEKIFAVRKDSPLIVGKGEEENYIASDMPAFLDYTNQFFILDDGEMAEVTAGDINLYDSQGKKIEKDVFEVDWNPEMAEKKGYDHYMLKEINEQPDALRKLFKDRINPGGINLEEVNLSRKRINEIDKIQVVACGTACHSGYIGKYVIEELARIPVDVDIASEFRYREPIIDKNTLTIVVSQSGETADTLAGLRLAREKGSKIMAFTNVVGSSIDREADEVLHLNAGPEIAVASTKAYLNMVAAFYLLGLYLARVCGTVSEERLRGLREDLLRLPELAARVIDNTESRIKELAARYAESDSSFFIGRNTDYTLAMEGALKLKEISYIQAEAYAAGELKHGTLALIEEGVPVVAIATRRAVFGKMLSNIKEVKARGADVLALAFKGAEDIVNTADEVIFIPEISGIFSGVLAMIPMQLLAYYTALERGCNIDQPRNLAKSVTVE
ncbi:MAG: glutamine--fructose-6-phosphate transaminase (isomerizing) [Halanaerobiales bacterium]